MPTRGSHKAARLLRLVAQLEAGPRTAADLARQLRFSHRTLQRDLEELPEIRHSARGTAGYQLAIWQTAAQEPSASRHRATT